MIKIGGLIIIFRYTWFTREFVLHIMGVINNFHVQRVSNFDISLIICDARAGFEPSRARLAASSGSARFFYDRLEFGSSSTRADSARLEFGSITIIRQKMRQEIL